MSTQAQTAFYRKMLKEQELVEAIEKENDAPYIIRKPKKIIKLMAEGELYRLAELTLEYKIRSPKMHSLKERLWAIIGIK